MLSFPPLSIVWICLDSGCGWIDHHQLRLSPWSAIQQNAGSSLCLCLMYLWILSSLQLSFGSRFKASCILIACSISKVWFSSHGVMPWWHHRVGWHSEEVWKSATVGERGIAERTWWAFCRKCGLLAPSSFAFCLFHFLSGPALGAKFM